MYHIMAGKYKMLGCSVQMKENAKVRLLYMISILWKKSRVEIWLITFQLEDKKNKRAFGKSGAPKFF